MSVSVLKEKYVLRPLTIDLIRKQGFAPGATTSYVFPATWRNLFVQYCEHSKIPFDKGDPDAMRGFALDPALFFTDFDGGPHRFQFSREHSVKFHTTFEDVFEEHALNPFASGEMNRSAIRVTIRALNISEQLPINVRNEIFMRGYTNSTFFVLVRESDGSVQFNAAGTLPSPPDVKKKRKTEK